LGKRRLPVKLGYVSARVPEYILREIEKIVWREGYADISDYIRNLIRKDLMERGIRFTIGGKLEGEEKEED